MSNAGCGASPKGRGHSKKHVKQLAGDFGKKEESEQVLLMLKE